MRQFKSNLGTGQLPGDGLSDQQQAALVTLGRMMGPQADEFDERVQALHDKRHQAEHDATDYEQVYGDRPHEAGIPGEEQPGQRVIGKKKSHPFADSFSDEEMDQIKRYGQALGGKPTPFDEEVERSLERRLRHKTRKMLQDMPQLWTVKDVAKYLHVSRATVYRWAGTKLPYRWLNGIRLVFDSADIERYEKQLREGKRS